jgi:hypothetical protein
MLPHLFILSLIFKVIFAVEVNVGNGFVKVATGLFLASIVCLFVLRLIFK